MMEFFSLIKFIKNRYNIDLLNYKESRIKKRTDLYMNRKNIGNYGELSYHLKDKNNFDEFLRFHRINVSCFLRDKTLFDCLISYISSKYEKTSFLDSGILSIGCSRGEELYSLLFLLRHHQINIPDRIIGIDSDRDQLSYAEKGKWNKHSIQNYDAFLQRFIKKDELNEDHYKLNSNIIYDIKFHRFDIMKDHVDSLLPEYGLVMCRNLIIYLNEDFRESFLYNISRLIIKGGLLFLGSSELIHNPGGLGLKYIDHAIYRKMK